MSKFRFVRTLLAAAALAWTALMIAPLPVSAAEDCPPQLSRRPLLRPRRQPDRRPSAERGRVGRSGHNHLLLHPGRGSGRLPKGVGRLRPAHGRGSRAGRSCSSGPVLRRTVRGHAVRPPARRRGEHRRQPEIAVACGRVRPVRDDGVGGTARSATRWRSSSPPTARSRPRRISRAGRSRSPRPRRTPGSRAPSAILKSEFGLVADTDFEATFSGKHDNSVLGVANMDYEAAAVANSVLNRMIDREVVDPREGALDLQVADLSDDRVRPPPTTCIPWSSRRSSRRSSRSRGKGRISRPSSGRKACSSPIYHKQGLGHHPQDRQGPTA